MIVTFQCFGSVNDPGRNPKVVVVVVVVDRRFVFLFDCIDALYLINLSERTYSGYACDGS